MTANETTSPLLRLPRELRDDIWELVLTPSEPEDPGDDLVHLADAPERSKALLLTCRSVFKEVYRFYPQDCNDYWTSTYFLLVDDGWSDPKTLKATVQQIEALDEADVNKISRLVLLHPPTSDSCSFNKGIWHWNSHLCDLFNKDLCPPDHANCGSDRTWLSGYCCCPAQAIVVKNSARPMVEARRGVIIWKYEDFWDSAGHRIHWVGVGMILDEELREYATRTVGWGKLTKREIVAMMWSYSKKRLSMIDCR